MKKDVILSVDIGTSFVKAGLYSSRGECLAVHREKTNQTYKNGALVQEADDYIEKFVSVVKTLTDGTININILAISFTGQMAGVVGVDKDLNAVTDWSGTVDSRQDLSMSDEADIQRVAEVSGTNTPIFAKKLKWFENQLCDRANEVHKYIGIISFVIAKITETSVENTIIQATNLAFTGIADMQSLSWSGELCSIFNIDTKQLPRIVDAIQIVGHISKRFADACGIKEGTPIVAGAGDKIAGCIGTGVALPGMIADESSTVGAMTLCVDEYKPNVADRSLEVIPGAEKGTYYMMFYIAGSGLAIDWFVREFASQEREGSQKSSTDVHILLDRAAARVPAGSDNLMCIGLLGGRALPFMPEIRGTWIGHTFSHTRAHFYRSLLESIAYEYKRAVDIMRREFAHLSIDSIFTLGGGSKSELWNYIKANVMRARYITLKRSDVALLGTSIIGGVAIGLYDSIEEGLEFAAKQERFFDPNEQDVKVYQRMYGIYIDVLNTNLHTFKSLKKEIK